MIYILRILQGYLKFGHFVMSKKMGYTKRMRYDVLIDLINASKADRIVEIGLGSGITAKKILEAIPDPGLRYVGVDPFKPYDASDINSTMTRLRSNKQSVKEIKDPRFIHVEDCAINKLNSIMEIMGTHINFVFIDGEHSYPAVIYDLNTWWDLIDSDGIIAGHDYDRVKMFPGVKKAVDEFVKEKDIELRFDADVYWFQVNKES